MSRPRGRRREMPPLRAGLILIIAIAIGSYFAYTKALPFQHHFTLHAAFRSTNNIKQNSLVRIAGVNVGKVTGIEHIPGGGGGAIVDMRIDDNGLPIHTDATATIRPRIFLEGNFFIDMHPGSPSAPIIHDGGMLPVQQTADPVQLDQILAILPSATRTDLQHLLRELSIGFSGRGGAGFNRSIPFWGPAYRDSAIVNTASLGTAQHDLSTYIASSGAVAAAIDASPPALRTLITEFNATATPLAQQNVALAAAVAELPNTLRTGIPSLRALDAAFPSLRKLSDELRPAVRSSLPVFTAGVPWATQASALVSKPELQGLIQALSVAVPSLAQLNTESVPLLQQVRYAAQCQNSVILPWSQQTLQDVNFPSVGPVYQEEMKAIEGTGGDSRQFDANGIFFRVLLATGAFAFPAGNGQFTLSNFALNGANPVKPAERPALQENVPCETQQQPNLTSNPSGPPPGEASTLPGGGLGLGLSRSYMSGANSLLRHLERTQPQTFAGVHK